MVLGTKKEKKMANEKKKTGKEKKIFGMGEMPHSLESEMALLGCLLLDNRVQTEIASSLKEEDFFVESHQQVFSAMKELIDTNQPVDLVTLSDVMEKRGTLDSAGGIEFITKLCAVMPSSANYSTYLDIVKRDSTLRKLIRESSSIITDCMSSTDSDKALADAEKKIFDVSHSVDTSTMVRIGKVIPDVMMKLDELSKSKEGTKGIKTNFRGLDSLLNGLHNSDLMIIAARPATGKTSFAMNIVENVALQGYSCAVFSLEMGKEQLVQRMICSVANVSMENASKGRLTKSEWVRIRKAQQLLANTKIYIDDSAMITPQEALSKCRRLKRKFGLDLVMIDYIQLMNSEKKGKSEENRQQEISNISRTLKILAKEINVPVLALSQLSRAVESRKGRPQLSDLRESGAIEQDADIVMFIHRPDKSATEAEIANGKVQPNVAEIIVEKHRNGPTGLVKLYFKGECTKFINLNEEGEAEELEGETPVKEPTRVSVEDLNALNKTQEDNDVFNEEAPFDVEVKPASVDDEIF